ncbi:MAG: hypothetical protein LQ346_005189 [Caloplaca aetnensis]|nr:MAG: hypothetical protein LQ346_005189 [Caloplaca aetnensis]
MDALKSFTHLTDSIPDWLIKLDDLAVQVADQHSRFARLTQSELTGLRLAKKHDSTESLRPPHDDLDVVVDHPPPVLTHPSALPKDIPPTSQPDPTLLVKGITRKRKSGSADLSAASGVQRYRTRSLVIVYYDSAIQDAFESLVRNISGARNNLRKGRTAASFKARMASMGMADDDDDGYAALNPKLMIKRAPKASTPSESPSFQKADEDLEAAQNLCEVAAHQFLRDGDCGEEIAGTRKRFEDCLETAKVEVQKLQAANNVEEGEEDSPKVIAESTPSVRTDTNASITLAADKIGGPKIPTIPTLMTNGTIEVDDNSDSASVHIDLTAFRRTRRV